MVAFYKPLLTHTAAELREVGVRFAAEDALATEADVFAQASEYSYKNSSISAAVSVTKRHADALRAAVDEAAASLSHESASAPDLCAILSRCTEIGSAARVTQKRELADKRRLGHLTRARVVKAGFLCPKGDLETLGYLTQIPEAWGPGGDRVNGVGERQTCVRCGTLYRVAPLGAPGTQAPEEQDPEACHFHAGRARREPGEGRRRVFRWTCCGRVADAQVLGDDRCTTGPHVFKEDDAHALHRRAGFVTFADLGADHGDEVLGVAALDCEMSYTTAGMSVTRITLVDETGDVIFDELIRCPDGVAVVDFNTQFSGIQPDEYEEQAIFDLDGARRALARYVGPNTILVRLCMQSYTGGTRP